VTPKIGDMVVLVDSTVTNPNHKAGKVGKIVARVSSTYYIKLSNCPCGYKYSGGCDGFPLEYFKLIWPQVGDTVKIVKGTYNGHVGTIVKTSDNFYHVEINGYGEFRFRFNHFNIAAQTTTTKQSIDTCRYAQPIKITKVEPITWNPYVPGKSQKTQMYDQSPQEQEGIIKTKLQQLVKRAVPSIPWCAISNTYVDTIMKSKSLNNRNYISTPHFHCLHCAR